MQRPPLSWSYTFEGMSLRTFNGTEIVHTVKENVPHGLELMPSTGNVKRRFVLTNKLILGETGFGKEPAYSNWL